MTQNVPIVMTMDENYVIPTKVAIWSVLRTIKKDYKVKIYILCNALLEQKYRADIVSLEKRNANVSISFLEVDSKIFNKAKTTGHIPVASYYRLQIPKLLNEDKCLFLDGDIIVRQDLYPLLSRELGENYIAGVKDTLVFWPLQQREEHRNRLDIPGIEGYVNAGIMLFNLKKMREDKLIDKFMFFLNAGFLYMDQDILNKVCYGHIMLLDEGYNYPAYSMSENQASRGMLFSDKNKMVRDEVKILHYLSRMKPWNNLRVPKSDLWWQCAKEILDKEIYDTIYKRVERENNVYNEAWQNILHKCRKSEGVIIFGFTDVGKEVATELTKNAIDNITCFCDNSEEKQTQYYRDLELEVCAPINALEKYPTATWLITNQFAGREIAEQLKEMGVGEEKILFYKKQF